MILCVSPLLALTSRGCAGGGGCEVEVALTILKLTETGRRAQVIIEMNAYSKLYK